MHTGPGDNGEAATHVHRGYGRRDRPRTGALTTKSISGSTQMKMKMTGEMNSSQSCGNSSNSNSLIIRNYRT